MKAICKFILKSIGWKIVGLTDIPDKCVICVAPHTSNWDLPLGLVIYTSMGKHASFLIKKDWFFFPMNLIFKAIGGVPVDRSKNTSLIEQMTDLYNSNEKFQLAVTPEGTRKHNKEWKKGFYYIALAAKVPIVVAAFDYKKKEADFKKIIIPTGDVEADILEIKAFYKGVTPRHPEKFAL
ncbi:MULTISPECIES: 1-acyl-sn-glycerol-3-phosphate acyltransferase [unclassified Dysgonomonas]|uniref:1-acyl-sn-glycerol-3-phosphate acyltransferase n=1 Tax=unclassified Dysgonomonas TaxID=2630389 RepID=UPI0013ECDE09|nr:MULTISPECIES: 1-acyl-sn-glycerol-3-phosphate acyltransferase [unclassified Dysgonomonas]